jgi:hypothetical protein
VTNETMSQSTGKARANRWLKKEDRLLIRAIVILQKQERILPELLFDSLNKNVDTKEAWMLIKSEILSDRSLSFLQSRYKRLIRNQKLNRHEKLFFSENYTKYSIEEFQIILPGKMKPTLLKLKKEFVEKNSKVKKADEILAEKLPTQNTGIVGITDASFVSFSTTFTKELSIDIHPYITLSSDEYLRSLAPKVLRKMQYSISEIVGEIYSELSALKASLKQDLVGSL